MKAQTLPESQQSSSWDWKWSSKDWEQAWICWAVPALVLLSPCLSMGEAGARRSQKFFSEEQHQAVGAVCPQQHWDWIFTGLWHVIGIGLNMEDLTQQCQSSWSFFSMRLQPLLSLPGWYQLGVSLSHFFFLSTLSLGIQWAPSKWEACPSLQGLMESVLHSWRTLLVAG